MVNDCWLLDALHSHSGSTGMCLKLDYRVIVKSRKGIHLTPSVHTACYVVVSLFSLVELIGIPFLLSLTVPQIPEPVSYSHLHKYGPV